MSGVENIPHDCIPANPDIAGIGIRTSVYIQALIGVVITLWALRDNEITNSEAHVVATHTTSVLVTSCALFFSGIIQANKYGMSTYHALILINLGWISSSCLYINAFVGWVQRAKAKPDSRCSKILIASFHRILHFGFALWFWNTIDTFGARAQCRPLLPIPLHILGRTVSVANPKTRKMFVIMYSLLISPVGHVMTIGATVIPSIMFFAFTSRVLSTFGGQGALNWLSNGDDTLGVIMTGCVITVACIDIILIVDTERMIREAKVLVQQGEDQWTFGQTITMILLVPPLIALTGACIRMSQSHNGNSNRAEKKGDTGNSGRASPRGSASA